MISQREYKVWCKLSNSLRCMSELTEAHEQLICFCFNCSQKFAPELLATWWSFTHLLSWFYSPVEASLEP
ncbi:hypothetical protein P3S67_012409 [Capsicum chacoense]